MPGIDLWRWSATRVEIDHRAREARLRLEQLERLLMLRLLPTRSWLRRAPHFRSPSGGNMQSRSEPVDPIGPRSRNSRHIETEIYAAVSSLAAIGGMARPSSPA
jgi:hypothetical protein